MGLFMTIAVTDMALRTPFSPMHSDLNDFLFAPIGEEKVGLLLTVASAMARLGIDPWAEAARLSALSPGAAAQVLVPMINQSSNGADFGDVQAIADRLVRLLPKSAGTPVVRSTRKWVATPSAAAWLVCLVLAVAFLTWTVKDRSSAIDEGTGRPVTNGDTSRLP